MREHFIIKLNENILSFRKGLVIGSFSFLICLLIASCEIDAYEKGEGDLSLLTAEMVEAQVDADKIVNQVETDQNERLILQPPITAKWIETADTVYRGLLYYKKVDGVNIKAVSFGKVGVLIPRDSIKGGQKTDPLYVESIWLSKNRKYLNLRLRLLTGSTDDEEAQHALGLLRDIPATTANHAHMLLYHDQGGRPEYYSVTAFASIPLDKIGTDTLTLAANTYNGLLTRTFVLR